MGNPTNESVAYWASAFQKRNPDALAYVFDLHYRPLCYYASTLLADQAEVEDIVSEAFVKLWERAHGFDNLASVKGFLYLTTKNRCLDKLKMDKRRQNSLREYTYATYFSDEAEDLTYLETQVLDRLYEAIEQLPDKARVIFKLLFFERLKTDEVADKLGLSVKTVRNQKARATHLLRVALFKKGLPVLPILVFLAQ